jgi:cell division protein FtsI (penicillin-binding protein 3)
LTLDASIQYVVERELAAAIERSNARRGSVVLMDPHTGAILAMASYPTFDPNHFGAYPEEHWRNRPVMTAFEPGSTLKMVTLAAALEGGHVRPDDVVDCGMGRITLFNTTINDHKPFGLLTVREVIAKSSNVGAIRTGLAAGAERFYATLRAFGFGRRTGIDLPGENPGLLLPLERWHNPQLTTAYLSFGQGISVTPLQLAVSFAAIANGGRLVRPYVVERVGSAGAPSGRTARAASETVGIPISRSSQREIVRILEAVVAEGTAKAAQIPGYPVAGKTGTAQVAISGQGYSPTKHIASFVGFAPVDRPAVVGLVVLEEPWPRYHGGDVAAPVFAATVEQTLLYLGVPPVRPRPERWPGEPPRGVG